MNQQPPSADDQEPGWPLLAGSFGLGLLVTIIPPLFFDAVIYLVQFVFCYHLFTNAKKSKNRTKKTTGYVLAAVMLVLAVGTLLIAFGWQAEESSLG